MSLLCRGHLLGLGCRPRINFRLVAIKTSPTEQNDVMCTGDCTLALNLTNFFNSNIFRSWQNVKVLAFATTRSSGKCFAGLLL